MTTYKHSLRCIPSSACMNLTTTVDYKLGGGPSPSPVLHVSTLLVIRKTHWILVIADSKYIAQLRYRSFNQLVLNIVIEGACGLGCLLWIHFTKRQIFNPACTSRVGCFLPFIQSAKFMSKQRKQRIQNMRRTWTFGSAA